MSVRLRLTRQGRKKRPFYRIVAVDSRRKRDGEFLDKIGHYDPLTRPPLIVVDETKAMEWLGKGALPSDTVKSLLSKKGIMMKFDLQKKGVSAEKISEEMAKRDLLQKARAEEAKKKAPQPAPAPEAEPVKAEEPAPVEAAAPAVEPAPVVEAAPVVETTTPPAEEPAKTE